MFLNHFIPSSLWVSTLLIVGALPSMIGSFYLKQCVILQDDHIFVFQLPFLGKVWAQMSRKWSTALVQGEAATASSLCSLATRWQLTTNHIHHRYHYNLTPVTVTLLIRSTQSCRSSLHLLFLPMWYFGLINSIRILMFVFVREDYCVKNIPDEEPHLCITKTFWELLGREEAVRLTAGLPFEWITWPVSYVFETP